MGKAKSVMRKSATVSRGINVIFIVQAVYYLLYFYIRQGGLLQSLANVALGVFAKAAKGRHFVIGCFWSNLFHIYSSCSLVNLLTC